MKDPRTVAKDMHDVIVGATVLFAYALVWVAPIACLCGKPLTALVFLATALVAMKMAKGL